MDVLDPVFPVQVRAARALLGWTQKELARRATVSEPFINRLERGDRLGHAAQLTLLRDALREAGIECVATADEVTVTLRGAFAQQLRRDWQAKR